MTHKEVTNKLRADYVDLISKFLEARTDICRTATGTLMIPVVDAAGDDRWVKISIIIPKDSEEENGNDGYSLAREYELKLKAAEERKKKRESDSKRKLDKKNSTKSN